MISREDLLHQSIIAYLKQSCTDNPNISNALEILEKCWAPPNHETEMALQRNALAFDSLITLMRSNSPGNSGCSTLGYENFDNSVGMFSDYLSHNPENIEAFLQRSSTHMKHKRYQNAIEDCEEVLSKDSRNPRAHAKKIISLWEQAKYDEARKAYEQATELCPNDDTIKDMASLFAHT